MTDRIQKLDGDIAAFKARVKGLDEEPVIQGGFKTGELPVGFSAPNTERVTCEGLVSCMVFTFVLAVICYCLMASQSQNIKSAQWAAGANQSTCIAAGGSVVPGEGRKNWHCRETSGVVSPISHKTQAEADALLANFVR